MSKFIGIKVLLNYICQIVNIAPTKVQLFLVISDGSGRKDIKELQTKGNSTFRLIDMDIHDDSEIVVF